jgi:hypothetical protein
VAMATVDEYRLVRIHIIARMRATLSVVRSMNRSEESFDSAEMSESNEAWRDIGCGELCKQVTACACRCFSLRYHMQM